MCGVLGIVTSCDGGSAGGGSSAISRDAFARVLARLAHRGPDGEGIVQTGLDGGRHVLLGHRRLAIIDPTEAGAQPMQLSRGWVAFNGEVYNDAEVRERVEAQEGPRRWRTRCDTETFGEAWLTLGEHAPRTLRGMYAGAIVDEQRRRLLLTRDPLGVKPLYWARGQARGTAHVLFASELQALHALWRELMGKAALPDMGTVSSYCTTIRTTMGERTLFDGLRVVLPGQTLEFDLDDPSLRMRVSEHAATQAHARSLEGMGPHERALRTREIIEQSVRAHLRSDMPICFLLSGGLDSAIVVACAKRELGKLGERGERGEHGPQIRTFCAGAKEHAWAGGAGGGSALASPDFAFASQFAQQLGTSHREVVVSREDFASCWHELVESVETPLSTPNEVAILRVSRALREQGCVVALSGEGADELFGGYDAPLDAAWRAIQTRGTRADRGEEGELAVRAAAWVPMELKGELFTNGAHASIDGDGALVGWARREFERLATCAGSSVGSSSGNEHPLQAHLRWLRATNLPGLLQRLDTSTMRAGVEGRTPFADERVRAWAEGLPMESKFAIGAGEGGLRTKLVLREAFGDLPEPIVRRPKASFPLPFEAWTSWALREDPRLRAALASNFAQATFSPACHEALGDPRTSWALAWPVANVALWGALIWG